MGWPVARTEAEAKVRSTRWSCLAQRRRRGRGLEVGVRRWGQRSGSDLPQHCDIRTKTQKRASRIIHSRLATRRLILARWA